MLTCVDRGPSRASAARPWQPLLEGRLRASASAAINAVVESLAVDARAYNFGPDHELSLLDGRAGFGVLHAYLARTRGASADAAWDHIVRAVALARDAHLGPSLHLGYPGIAWAAQHIGELLADPIDPAVHDPVDDLLVRAVPRVSARDRKRRAAGAPAPQHLPHGLLFGLAGTAIYAIDRGQRGRSALAVLVEELARRARAVDDGVTWDCAPEDRVQAAQYPDGFFDLGVDRGVAGVAVVLARALAAGIEPTRTRALLDGALAWMWAQRTSAGRIPYRVAHGADSVHCFGWCKGQLGLAVALVVIAEILGTPEWYNRGVELAQQVAAETDPQHVAEAALHRGAAGAGHLFHRLHHLTGDPAFAAAAVRWYERALALRTPGRGVGGFFLRDMDDGPAARQGIVGGAAGIALALLAATANVEPRWDRILAASTAGPTDLTALPEA